jgi:catechol 2,3-dioxygenase-like lactoylglutathione lyase family enzyme
MDARLTLVTLGVADLARARAFYADGLGWTVSPASNGDIVFFQLSGMVLALHPRTALADDAGVPSAGSGFRGIALAQNVRGKDEVRQALAAVLAAGGTIVRPAQEAAWGGYSGYVADPDGHLWEIAWNPHFPLTARGEIALP